MAENLAKGNELWSRQLQSSADQGFCRPEGWVYTLDPGETTGRCRLGPSGVHSLTQLTTKSVVEGYTTIKNDILDHPHLPEVIVCEGYVVYSWKSDDHKWANLHTPQLIGAIKVIAHQLNIPLKFQLAVQAKGFVTDVQLENWGCYVRGMKHARDAQRHALYYRMLGGKPYTGKGSEHVDGANQ